MTAGPTHEPIDAVRYLGNRSSGRMGLALAAEAARKGYRVTLLLGPTSLAPPVDSRIAVHRFRTAADLQRVLVEHWPRHDVLIMAAAVADYRPTAAREDIKWRREDGRVTLELEPTPDLIAEVAAKKTAAQRIIGFALEPADQLLESAREKMRRKGIDAIVANPLETMESESITATLLLADGRILRPEPGLAKTDFARWLIEQVNEIARGR
jgi:phosphopantothenoylcysteine decarboxylase/phosphopantothenate--cysteine ligase